MKTILILDTSTNDLIASVTAIDENGNPVLPASGINIAASFLNENTQKWYNSATNAFDIDEPTPGEPTQDALVHVRDGNYRFVLDGANYVQGELFTVHLTVTGFSQLNTDFSQLVVPENSVNNTTSVNLLNNSGNHEVVARGIRSLDATAVIGSPDPDSIEQNLLDGQSALLSGQSVLSGENNTIQTVVDAIKTQTDKLNFSAGNFVQVDIKKVNGKNNIDGVALDVVQELVIAMVNGNFVQGDPDPDKITFYKRDGVTPLFIVQVTDTQRTKVSGP